MKILSEILKNIHFRKITGSEDKPISKIEFDSRNVVDNSLFVAVKGTTSDGHDFIENAIEKGASAIIYEQEPDIINKYSEHTFIEVENSQKALALAAHNFLDNPTHKLNVFAITGTNGKTTITYLLKSIFDEAGLKTGIIGTTGIFAGNVKIPATHTTPDQVRLSKYLHKMLNEGISNVFMEVSSHSLHQHRAYGIKFTGAIFTNLTHDHLDYHKTMEDYAKAKKILFDGLEEDSIAVINSDSEYSVIIISDCKSRKIIKVGRNEPRDFLISDEKLHIDKTEFNLHFDDKIIKIETPLIGRFNIENIAFCFAIAIEYGISEEIIVEALKKAKGAPGRMERYTLKNRAIAIVDYSHTPDAMEKAINSCRDILHSSGNDKNKIIAVFGCGGDRDNAKRPVMGRIATEFADLTIITNDNPRNEDPTMIISDILKGVASNYYFVEQDRKTAIEKAYGFSKENDIILVMGKGHEDYQIIGKEKHHFSDSEEIRKLK